MSRPHPRFIPHPSTAPHTPGHASPRALVLLLLASATLSACQSRQSSPALPPLHHAPTYRSVLPADHPPMPGLQNALLTPEDHRFDWLNLHGPQARTRANDCLTCHLEEDCTSCHLESLASNTSLHPPNYLVVHALDARQGVQDCASCHQAQTFCTSCHLESKVAPEAPPELQPPSGFALHPPGWLDPASPRNHGIMARRDIFECASCHSESDCVSCHTGINPHPPEFRFECRSWLNTNPAPCARCHLEPAALEAGCL
ncbi:hypothetical protein DL240_02335 [Lujinxingia litoralis]|uniref:Uncharacterized protein n=1 Tax=Lujinxingia litoralis TaxID=2211119 RepID=A0A328CE20_9DELT|nr:hypothetical protein [Lujinxingia litoralis]RAL25073.1 hypothetical protein DL240_02335 [Lujinxingia litoralis]